MSTIEKLGATPMPAASIVHPCPMNMLEYVTVLDALYLGAPAGSEEEARRNKELYDRLSPGFDWEEHTKKGLKGSEFKTLKEPASTLTKAQFKTLQELAKRLAGSLQGRNAFAMLDLMDRVHFILTAD